MNELDMTQVGELIGKYASKLHELTGPVWDRLKRAASKDALQSLRRSVECIRPMSTPSRQATEEERTAMLAAIEATKANVIDMIDSMLKEPEDETSDEPTKDE